MVFPTREAWRSWLDSRHDDVDGVWLKIARAGNGIASVSHPEALEVALSYGWIDGRRASYDELYWTQRFGQRRARSMWSKVNREKAERLIASGEMQPAGLREVERARADGRWDVAYDAQSAAQVPDDLAREFDRVPGARAFFDTLDSRNRYAVLHRIQTAKRPETRARRIEKFVAMLARGEKIHNR
jgi:uncharacterized protein YdeI (YjbR/CyaY-like superfamily)